MERKKRKKVTKEAKGEKLKIVVKIQKGWAYKDRVPYFYS